MLINFVFWIKNIYIEKEERVKMYLEMIDICRKRVLILIVWREVYFVFGNG